MARKHRLPEGSGPRLRRGLPRGGIGFLGLAVGAVAVALAFLGRPPWPLLGSAIAAPICLWFGLGLRADGDRGEVTEAVTWETKGKGDWLYEKPHAVTEFRISSAIFLMAVTALAVAIYRLYDPR